MQHVHTMIRFTARSLMRGQDLRCVELEQTTRSTCNRSIVRNSGCNLADMLREWGAVGRRRTVVGDRGRTNWLDKIQEGVGGHYSD